jgi:hypothetical protein
VVEKHESTDYELLIDKCVQGDKQCCEKLKMRRMKMKQCKKGIAKKLKHCDRIFRQLEESDPALAKRLKKRRKADPEKFRRVMSATYADRHMFSGKDEKAHRRDFSARINQNIRQYEIIEAYKKTKKKKKREKLRQELKNVISAKFEIRTRDVESRIKAMEYKIVDLKKDLFKRQENKSRIVEKRADLVLAEQAGGLD